MRAVVQRVLEARVIVNKETVGQIGPGLLVYLGVQKGDSNDDMLWTAEKVIRMRIFPDSKEHMQYPVTEIAGGILVISQFTLCADVNNGARPDFHLAENPAEAEAMYEAFVLYLSGKGVPVQTGQFGAMMRVESVNDGPLTILLDSKEKVA
ncbi:MAG: D-aminoacyl-tRNA deacylase [Candidatus Gracilibacteria bacterium]